MAIDLNKNNNELKYYYSEDGKTVGPYSLSLLLEKIDAETLVYREGIEWTTAKLLPDLSSHFPEKKVYTPPVINKTDTFQMSSTNDFVLEPKKMFANTFSFDGRIRRTEYGLSFIIYLVLYAIVIGLVKASGIFLIAYIPLLWFLWAQGAKRCHDRGNSGWYQLIPFYVFWLLFAEGDKLKNEFGNPAKN